MVALAKVPVFMPVEDFLAWEAEDGRKWQLVDGEPQAMTPANRTHAAIQGEVARVVGNHLERAGSPCSVLVEPGVVPRVQARHNVRIPDLAVTCSPYDTEEAALTDPVLVVEILSPSNQAETWANVWAYATIPSVREIVVFRTTAIVAEVLRRRVDGTWPEEPERLADGDLMLDSVGLRTPLAGLYRTTRLGGAILARHEQAQAVVHEQEQPTVVRVP